jgi:transposase
VFAKILQRLAKGGTKVLMIDTMRLKVHRTASKRKASPRQIGRTRGGLGSKIHAICDASGRPVRLPLTTGNVSGIVGGQGTDERLTGCGLPTG